MTQGRLRSLLTLIIWGAVAVGFGYAVFSSGGPGAIASDRGRRILAVAFLAFGFLSQPAMLYVTRIRPGARHVLSDERDERLGHRSTIIGFSVVVLYVYLACLGLWEHYHEPGLVPAGWLWLLAYSTVILTFVAPSIAFLVQDVGKLGHAEG